MKILTFGALGMMGTVLEKTCGEKGIEFIGQDLEDVDITNNDALRESIEKNKPDVVINMAVIQGVDPAELKPQLAFDVNSIAVSNMAKICQEKGLTIVQPSSHAVFDGTKDGAYTEDDVPNPGSIYAGAKYLAECFAKNICTKHYVPRFAGLFGSSRYERRGFAEKMIERIKKGEVVRVAADKVDSPTYTIDAAERIIFLLESKAPYGTYHVANDGIATYYEFIAKIIEMLGADPKLLTAAKDADFPSLGYKPLKSALKTVRLKPMRPWQEALAEYVEKELK